ncbi:MAG: nuclear transport factor 2 family protein [Acidobacteriota bacterium]
MDLKTLHGQLIGYLEEGKFAEGIEDFYAEDVVARENGNPPRTGRASLAEAERGYLADVTAYHGITVHHTAIEDHGQGSGVVVYEAEMRWDHSKDGQVHVQQCVVERWSQGKISDIRFYGTFIP